METFLTIFAVSTFIALEVLYRLNLRNFIKSQQAFNRWIMELMDKQTIVNQETINNFKMTNGKLVEVNQRVINAGTKIIELNNALVLPDEEKERLN